MSLTLITGAMMLMKKAKMKKRRRKKMTTTKIMMMTLGMKIWIANTSNLPVRMLERRESSPMQIKKDIK